MDARMRQLKLEMHCPTNGNPLPLVEAKPNSTSKKCDKNPCANRQNPPNFKQIFNDCVILTSDVLHVTLSSAEPCISIRGLSG